jgi:hypothetical protein
MEANHNNNITLHAHNKNEEMMFDNIKGCGTYW